jgi:hypothetical protein
MVPVIKHRPFGLEEQLYGGPALPLTICAQLPDKQEETRKMHFILFLWDTAFNRLWLLPSISHHALIIIIILSHSKLQNSELLQRRKIAFTNQQISLGYYLPESIILSLHVPPYINQNYPTFRSMFHKIRIGAAL